MSGFEDRLDDNYNSDVCEPRKQLTDKIVMNIVFIKPGWIKQRQLGIHQNVRLV